MNEQTNRRIVNTCL